jgi:hypothetical protein
MRDSEKKAKFELVTKGIGMMKTDRCLERTYCDLHDSKKKMRTWICGSRLGALSHLEDRVVVYVDPSSPGTFKQPIDV